MHNLGQESHSACFHAFIFRTLTLPLIIQWIWSITLKHWGVTLRLGAKSFLLNRNTFSEKSKCSLKHLWLMSKITSKLRGTIEKLKMFVFQPRSSLKINLVLEHKVGWFHVEKYVERRHSIVNTCEKAWSGSLDWSLDEVFASNKKKMKISFNQTFAQESWRLTIADSIVPLLLNWFLTKMMGKWIDVLLAMLDDP